MAAISGIGTDPAGPRWRRPYRGPDPHRPAPPGSGTQELGAYSATQATVMVSIG
jgi:hypothetical protein